MTKAKISEYDAVAANNTDVNGVNIAENCPPSGMNNMGREIMAALKRFQTGSDSDGVTVGGNLVVSGTVTAANTATLGNVDVNGGTIDGTTIGGASAAVGTFTQVNVDNLRLDGNAITSTNTDGNIDLTPNGTGEVNISKVDIDSGTIDGTAIGGASAAAGSFTTLNTSGQVVFNDAGADVDFRVEGDTNANLLFVDASADNVGIGTSSPSTRLEVSGTQNGVLARFGAAVSSRALTITQYPTFVGGTNEVGYDFDAPGSGSADGFLRFSTNSTERMRIDSGGNLLVGTTSAWFDRVLVAERASGDVAVFIGNTVGSSAINMLNTATSGDNAFTTFFTEARATPTLRGGIDYNRGAGLVRYNTTSDATLKNIIGDSDGQKSVEILTSTKIREFAWKDDETQKSQIGVIAQELYETFKGAVSVGGDVEKQRDVTEEVEEEYIDEEGNTQTRTVTNVVGQEAYTEYRPWGVDKTAFTFHLVAGWQAHEKIIKQQAEMIAALEARIAALEGQ